jgi:hypothetical protein
MQSEIEGIMTEREPQDDPAPRKPWSEPELSVFPMSDAEAPTPAPSGVDAGSNAS